MNSEQGLSFVGVPCDMLRLRLMHDWFCWPLWCDDPVGNVSPDELPIGVALAERLKAWSARYDEFLDLEDPKATFIDADSKRSLKREALELWKALRDELPAAEFQVDLQWGRPRFADPSELPSDWLDS